MFKLLPTRHAPLPGGPTVWTSAWEGDFPWPKSDDKLYEYACHEGNYALGNIMRGARLLEADIQKQDIGGSE